jgi:DNA-directed RNA polymerase subunit K/omega
MRLPASVLPFFPSSGLAFVSVRSCVYTALMADTDLSNPPAADEAATAPAPPITSRFLFVDVAAQRAKQLRRGALPRVDRQPGGPNKLERMAMEEVRRGAIQYTLPTGYDGKTS